jgi:hypothetical protein
MNAEKGRGSTGSFGALVSVDAEINHLERILCLEIAHTVFGQTYWRARVMQLQMTPGLVPEQRVKVQRLLSLLEQAARG